MPSTLPDFLHGTRFTPFVAVVSGPSGVGKTVICDQLLEHDPDLVRSVSATTRARRDGEIDGDHYFFHDEASFREMVAADGFLEWAEVHGRLYGTPRTAVQEILTRGKLPLLNVDVQGGRSVKQLLPDAVLVFLAPPSMDVLRSRLQKRGTETPEVIAARLANASRELDEWVHYDYLVINDDLTAAVAEVRGILAAERLRVARRTRISR